MDILAFAGSTRTNSFNKVVVQAAADYVKARKFNVNLVDLSNYAVPLYDGDLEDSLGLPENAIIFRELLKRHQIFLIASPEYNGSISGVLKNMLDWCSRPYNNEDELICFREKMVILLSASPGNLGGVRGLTQLNNLLYYLGCVVLPFQLSISKAHEEIQNQKLSEKILQRLQVVVEKNLQFINKLKDH